MPISYTRMRKRIQALADELRGYQHPERTRRVFYRTYPPKDEWVLTTDRPPDLAEWATFAIPPADLPPVVGAPNGGKGRWEQMAESLMAQDEILRPKPLPSERDDPDDDGDRKPPLPDNVEAFRSLRRKPSNMTWGQIARLFGVTRSAAYGHYRRLRDASYTEEERERARAAYHHARGREVPEKKAEDLRCEKRLLDALAGDLGPDYPI